MAGDVGDLGLQIQPLGLENTDHGDRDSHQRRLGVGRQGQGVLGAIEHDVGELFTERLVNLFENGAGFREILGQILAHANGLTALAGKSESNGHSDVPDCAHRGCFASN